MKWEVYRNGKSLGIVETNWKWASQYWLNLPKSRGRFDLRPA